MNCLYCNKECQFIELDDIQTKAVEVYKCTNCPHVVRYGKFINEEIISMICIQLRLHDKRYAVHLITEKVVDFSPSFNGWKIEKSCQIVEIKPILLSGERIDMNVKKIAVLEGHPNITPFNIEDKLPIYITFS